MPSLEFAWSPRLLMAGRTVRLPLRLDADAVGGLTLDLDGFAEVGRRWDGRSGTLYLYVRAPGQSGDRRLTARVGGRHAAVDIGVRSLEELRRPVDHNGAAWPRRWPLGQAWTCRKDRQTLTQIRLDAADAGALAFWLEADDAVVWRQLPPAEWPRSHFVNCHEGCPRCGTAIFAHGGFYPWQRRHTPADFRSTCPSCGLTVPDNDLVAGDYVGAGDDGAIVDDGYGYVDAGGALFLFAATYCRDQTRAFGGAIGQLAAHVRTGGDAAAARRLALLLLRYAAEEVYVAAVPQFRYGPTLGTERLFTWTTTGQTDWAAAADPVAALYRMGTQRYCIDTPYIAETLAIAYDTVWPWLRADDTIVARAAACGLPLDGPAAAVQLVEEMLASLLQAHLDGGASSNLPRVSEGVLVLLRALQRGDAQAPLTWVYDAGPDHLRVFPTNDFFPDGTPPEATGGYNNIHANGLFSVEEHLQALKADHPGAYPDAAFGSLLADPRAVRVAHAPHDIAMLGRAFLGFGDGGGPACQRPLAADAYHVPLPAATLERAARLTGDPGLQVLRDDVAGRRHRARGATVLDGVGLAVLRTGGAPERAAAGVVYGDATGHRHNDLLDVQLWAFDQPFLSDLGYPQSWASLRAWEGHWATHNTVWATVPGVGDGVAGRGRLVRHLAVDGVQLLELAAERWAVDDEGRWFRPGVSYRRLLALVDTDGDGVALVDLARVRGGDEHWRVCRGLEGTFSSDEVTLERVGGTIADPEGQRGDTARLRHPDHAGLAWLDDVAVLSRATGWRGRWDFAHGDTALDLHAPRVSGGAHLRTARATAIMGSPETSAYAYQPVLWQRQPRDLDDVTCFDLVFEPHRGAATLAAVEATAGDDPEAVGLSLTTAAGLRLRLWWSPAAGAHQETRFDDGTRLAGPLAVARGSRLTLVGGAALHSGAGLRLSQAQPRQQGRIVALDRDACTVDVDVDGLDGIAPGHRLTVNPAGRGRSYRVEAVEPRPAGGLRLRLDVTSVLGTGPVTAVTGVAVTLGARLVTRTGYLHGARLEGGAGDAVVDAARNPGGHAVAVTELVLEAGLALRLGDWVRVVDYIVGDEVVWEPAVSSG